jgi:hypothetical protein
MLRTLERSARRLDPAVARALHDEIAAHLDAAIQARMELGESPEEAERNAVAAFGDVRGVARQIADEARIDARAQRHHLAAFVGFFAAFAIALAGSWTGAMPDVWSTVLFVVASFVLVPALVVAAYRARRPRWGLMLLLYPVVSLWFGVGFAAAYLPDAPPPIIGTARRELPRLLAEAQMNVSRLATVTDQVNQARAEFERGGTAVPVGDLHDPLTLTVGHAASHEAAADVWGRVPEDGYRSRLLSAKGIAGDYGTWAAQPWWYGIDVHLRGTQVIVGPWYLIMLGLSAFGAGLRVAVDRLRRRRPRGGTTA